VTPWLEGLGRSARAIAGVFFLAVALGGCALVVPQTDVLHSAWPADLPERAEIADVPFFPEEDYQCGPAALASSLASFKVKVTAEDLFSKVYLPGRRGSLQVEMLAGARGYGMVSYQIAPRYADVLREIAAGTPVIVLLDYGVWPISIWHYAVVTGYDRAKGQVIVHSGVKKNLPVPFAVLEYIWKESHYWAMVTMPPDRLPATATESSYLPAIVAMERVAEPRAARDAYRSFLGRWPDNLTASIGLANAEHSLGELEQAAAVLRRASAGNPGSVIALNNLAQTLSDLNRGEEAMAVIDQAAALVGAGGPFADAVRDTRASILQRMTQSSR
jgi:hypothetical protein